MKWVCFLLMILLLPTVFSAKYYVSDQNKFTDIRNFSLTHFPDGMVEIEGKKIGFALTGTILGLNQIRTTKNFNWTWTYDENTDTKKYLLSGKNDSLLLPITQDWNLLGAPKIKYTIQNRLASITNAVFWWVVVLDRQDMISFANEKMRADFTREFSKEQMQNFILRPEINQKFGFDFQDLVKNGFELTGMKIKDGAEFDYDGEVVLAIGFTKNAGNFPLNSTVEIDPTILDTGFLTPSSSGIAGKNQANQWTNGDNILTDNTVYATVSTAGLHQGTGDFNISLDTDAAIRSINVEGNGKANCLLLNDCTATIGARISDDNGTTYSSERTAIWECIFGTPCEFTIPLSFDPELGTPDNFDLIHNFRNTSFSNGTFLVDLKLVSFSTFFTSFSMDTVRVKIDYVDNQDNNVLSRTDGDKNFFHLAIADINTQFANRDSVMLYFNGDVNFPPVTAPALLVNIDLSRNQNLLQPFNTGIGCGWVSSNCWNNSACWDFNASNSCSIHPEQIIDFDDNRTITVNAYVFPDINTAGFAAIATKSNTALPYWGLRLASNASTGNVPRARMTIQTATGTTNCDSNEIIYPNRWWQLSGTYDGNSIKTYVNGNLETVCARTGQMQNNLESFITQIGGQWVGVSYGNFFTGQIDELMILDTNLSQSQIQDLNAGTTNLFYPTGYKDFNSMAINSTHNSIDVYDTNAYIPNDSNVSIKVGDYNSVYQFGVSYAGTSILSGTDTNFSLMQVHTPANFALRFNLTAGGSDANTFFTPIVDANFLTKTAKYQCNQIWEQDFNISCSSNCSINENIDLNNNKLILNNDAGAGTITCNFDVNNWTQVWVENTCQLNNAQKLRSS